MNAEIAADLKTLRNRNAELEARLRFAESCADFHLATAERAKAHADRLWCAAKAAEGRHGQNARLREMVLELRERLANAGIEVALSVAAGNVIQARCYEFQQEAIYLRSVLARNPEEPTRP